MTLEISRNQTAVDKAIAILDESFGTITGNAARTLLANAASQYSEILSEDSLAFTFRNIGFSEQNAELNERALHIGRLLWSRNPELVVGAFRASLEETSTHTLTAQVVATLSIDELLRGLALSSNVLPEVIGLRRDLLLESRFWALLGGQELTHVISLIPNDSRDNEAMILAMIESNKKELPRVALHAFGSYFVFCAVVRRMDEERSENPTDTLALWLRTSMDDAESISRAFAQSIVRKVGTLAVIARATNPDFLPNGDDEDPWWTEIKYASGELSDGGQRFLSIFVLARALGNRSRNQAELISHSFDGVYSSAFESRLSPDEWTLLEPRLPDSIWWHNWDYCVRLRVGVVNAYVERKLPPESFTSITKNDDLFLELAGIAAQTRTGREYLANVGHALSIAKSAQSKRRIKLLNTFL
jgi:hypothetical protein